MAYIALPSGAYTAIREGETAETAWLRVQREHPEEFQLQPEKPTKQPEGGFGPALSAGLSRLFGETALTAGKAGILDLAKAEEIYRRQQKKAEGIFKPTEKGWTEDPLRKLAETAGGSAAYMLLPAAAGAAALAAPVVAPGLAGAAGVGALGAGLAGLAGLGQYTGSNLAAQMEEGKKGLAETSGLAAVGAAVPQAALDVLSFKLMPGIQRLFGSLGREVTEDQAKALASQSLRQKIGDYAAATGQSMGIEGATEVAQDMLEKLQAGASLTDPKAREDYLENLIGGAALAGVLGPFGRGFERAGIQAKGRQLEAARLDRERQAALAAQQEAVGREATQQFGTLFPEVGPASPLYGTPELAQKRLAQIEQEAEQARQAKDMDALLRLQRERTTLEQQVSEQPSGVEQRQALEQQLAYYQNIEAKLIEQARAAPTAAEKRPILEKLVEVQNQRRQLANAIEQQERQGAIPTPKTYEGLLRQEKATSSALRKAEEAGDAAAQLKLTDRLAGLQEQLGLFGQEAYTAQQQFEAKQAEDAAAAEAAARAAQPVLQLTDQRGATPIPMGYNFDTFPTPPRTPQAYLQGNLFGPEERVQVPGGTETTLPALQRAVSKVAERPDLAPEDRSLLDRISDLVLPKRQISTVPGLQKELDTLAERQQSVAQSIDQKRGAQVRLQQKIAELQRQIAAYKTSGAQLEEQLRQAPGQEQRAQQELTEAQEAGPPMPGVVAATEEQKKRAAALPGKAIVNAEQLKQAEALLRGLTKKEADVRQRTDRSIAKLERLQENLRKERSMRAAQQEALPSTAAPIERFTSPIEVRDAEGNVKTRATPAQLIADFVSDLSRGVRPTQSRVALEQALGEMQQAAAKGVEPITAPQRRIATPEERETLGKRSVVEQKPTGETRTADQGDLFAGTEAARATETETPEQLQEKLASEELQKQRAETGRQLLAKEQEVGPPKLSDVQRFRKLLQPTKAFFEKQVTKLKGLLGTLNNRLARYEKSAKEKTETQQAGLLAAKQQLADVLTAIETSFSDLSAQYQQARQKMQDAQETLAGLKDFQARAEEVFATIMRMSDEWASVEAKANARFQSELEERHENFRRAMGRLGVLRGEISNKFGDILAMEAPALEAGAAFDPELVRDYTAAKNAADKAAKEFYNFVAQRGFSEGKRQVIARQKPETPAHWQITDKDIKQFLTHDLDMVLLLADQAKTLKHWTYTVHELEDKLASARDAAKADPEWSKLLDEANKAVSAAVKNIASNKSIPTKPLLDNIRRLNTEIRNLRNETEQSLQRRIQELEAQRAAIIPYTFQEKLEVDQLSVEESKKARDRINAAKLEKLRPIDAKLAELRQELALTAGRQRSISVTAQRAEAEKKTVADIRAENERLEQAAAETRRISFEGKLTREQQAELKALEDDLSKLLDAKENALEAKKAQTKGFKLEKTLQQQVASGAKTREQAVEEKRNADLAKIAADFDKKIARVQTDINALLGRETSVERREQRIAQAGNLSTAAAQESKYDWTLSPEQAEEITNLAVSQLTPAQRKAVIDGKMTLEEAVAESKRTGPVHRVMRPGRMTGKWQKHAPSRTPKLEEGPLVKSQRDLTDAQQQVETAEVNRLSAEQQQEKNTQHLRQLLAFANTTLKLDLNPADYTVADIDALEKLISDVQANEAKLEPLRSGKPALSKKREASEIAQVRALSEQEEPVVAGKKTAAEKRADAEARARIAAQNQNNPFNRIISHDYAARENTPLDDATAAAVGKGDLVAALTSLAKNGSTPFVRMVAQRLLPMVENTKLETATLEGKGGEYDTQTDTVTLNKDALTEEDLLHEAGHAATNTVASYEAEGGMTRRQFLKGAVTGLTALKLPNITENMSLAAQEEMFFDMLQAWDGWVKAANKIAPALKLDPYINLSVADRDLRGFLTELEYNEVSDHAVVELLENGGLKKLQASINASQRAIMAEAAKTSEGKAEAKKETFTPTKEQLAARTALEKLYAKMQGRPEFKDEYGNVSFKEFVSELLSNQQVRDKIDQTKGLLRRIYEGFLRMLGIEPTTLSDKAVEQAFAMFSPSTAGVGREERLASIMRGVFPGTAATFSASVPQSISDTVNRTIARSANVGDKVVANLNRLRLRTFIADNWAPTDELRKMGVASGKLKEAQSLQMQVYMRLFSNMQEYTNSALINGVPKLKADEAGIRTIEGGDSQVNAKTIAKALGKASALGNQQAVERTFTLWMASLRAKQDGVGFEKLNFNLNPAEMAKLKQSLVDLEAFFKANPTVKDAFDEARELYRKYNRQLLDLQVQTKVMSKEVADELAKGDYIGYYRVNNNGVVELMLGGSRPVRVGNVIDQPYLKELVGGDQHILPFFASMTQNTSLLMSMALKNMQHTNTAYMFQDLGLGKIHSVPEGKEPPVGKLRFKQNGQDYWFAEDASAFDKMDVPFDLVMQGLQGVKTAVPALVKAMAVPANILRKTVRRMPLYTLRQTIRDPSHAWLTTGGNFVPVLSTWKEMYRGFTNQSETQITLKEAAVIGNHVYSGDTEGVTQMLRDLSSEPSKFSQIMTKLDELAMQGEAATRAVLYDDFRKREMGHVEALLNTAEVMNFSRRGTSASLHWLSQMTPFFNAQIQGLDAAYRALRGDTTFEAKLQARNALLKRGALMAAATMAYALLMEDDETYKNSTPEERYGNWFVRVPGTDSTVRVPIPFELGLIFKSLPEAFINVAYGDKKSSEAAKALAKQVYMSSPFGVPTAVKGPLEVMFNYNMYSDQPIETAHERNLTSDQRYRNSTTELAKLLGKTGLISPVQIDHLVRSYTGSAGIMLLSMANFALRPVSGRTDVEKPDMALNEVPVIGSAFQPTTGRGMVNATFEDIGRYQQAAATYKALATSDPEAAREFANKFAREIAMAPTGGSFRQQMGEFAQYKRMIAANPGLTGAQKREQIEAIKRQEIEYAKRVRQLAA